MFAFINLSLFSMIIEIVFTCLLCFCHLLVLILLYLPKSHLKFGNFEVGLSLKHLTQLNYHVHLSNSPSI